MENSNVSEAARLLNEHGDVFEKWQVGDDPVKKALASLLYEVATEGQL